MKPPSRFTSSSAIQSQPRMKEALAALRKETRTPEHAENIQQALVYGDALRDQLHRARKLSKSWKYAHQYRSERFLARHTCNLIMPRLSYEPISPQVRQFSGMRSAWELHLHSPLPYTGYFHSQQEPISHHTDLELAQELLEAADTLIISVLTLEAYLVDNPSHCSLSMVSDFCNSVDEALRLIVKAIREGQPLSGFLDLQEALRRLQERKSGHLLQEACRSDLRFVLSEARRMVGILNEMKEMMGEAGK